MMLNLLNKYFNKTVTYLNFANLFLFFFLTLDKTMVFEWMKTTSLDLWCISRNQGGGSASYRSGQKLKIRIQIVIMKISRSPPYRKIRGGLKILIFLIKTPMTILIFLFFQKANI